jgi:hypothetical protein
MEGVPEEEAKAKLAPCLKKCGDDLSHGSSDPCDCENASYFE